MTHRSPDGGAASRPPSMLSRQASPLPAPSHPALPHLLNGQVLMPKIVHRRARLAELETEMVAACEAAAVGACSQASGLSKHKHRDRAARHHYLTTAMRLEAAYGPQMRRLRQEIGQLERLIELRTLPDRVQPQAPCPPRALREKRKHPLGTVQVER